jgi:hypothetical protein
MSSSGSALDNLRLLGLFAFRRRRFVSTRIYEAAQVNPLLTCLKEGRLPERVHDFETPTAVIY